MPKILGQAVLVDSFCQRQRDPISSLPKELVDQRPINIYANNDERHNLGKRSKVCDELSTMVGVMPAGFCCPIA